MKSTESFKNVIQTHLDNLAMSDEQFAQKLKNKKKSIDECVTYILNQVKASGCNGFADEEIFGMAIHYYDEENIKVGGKVKANVVVNHKVELSPEEINKAKQEAKNQVIAEEMDRLRGKDKKAKKANKTDVEPTLFD